MREAVEKQVRAWLAECVVGLNLCPFAKPFVFPGQSGVDRLCITLCLDQEPEALRNAFLQELDFLQSSSEQQVATSLLVFPTALQSFDDYLDYFEDAQSLLSQAGLEGLFQLASFHPDYQFAGESAEAAGNFSNRAPYPIIHFLREDMMERVLQDFPNPENIPDQNIATLEGIGAAELKHRWEKLFDQD